MAFLAAWGRTSQRLPGNGQAAKPRKRGTKICGVIAHAGAMADSKEARRDGSRAGEELVGSIGRWLVGSVVER